MYVRVAKLVRSNAPESARRTNDMLYLKVLSDVRRPAKSLKQCSRRFCVVSSKLAVIHR